MKPSETDLNGRNNSGRFQLGNRCGKGHPFNRMASEFRAAIFKATTAERFDLLWETLWNKAASGDLDAMKLVLSYIIGKPISAPEEQPERLIINVGIRGRTQEECDEIRRESSAKFIEQRSDETALDD